MKNLLSVSFARLVPIYRYNSTALDRNRNTFSIADTPNMKSNCQIALLILCYVCEHILMVVIRAQHMKIFQFPEGQGCLIIS